LPNSPEGLFDETDLEAVFTKNFARLNPSQNRLRALSIKLQIFYPVCRYQGTGAPVRLGRLRILAMPGSVGESGGSDRIRTCDPRLIKAVL
jgi:hypothetical protein